MQVSIEQTIERVESLFTAITGRRPQDVEERRAAFPPEIDPVVHVEQQVARMLSAFEQLVARSRAPQWMPHAVALQDEHGLVFVVEVPGVAREQIEIGVAGTTLTVTGYRPPPVRDMRGPWGTFTRSFPLPAHVSPEQVSSHLENGVLTLRIGQKRGTTSQSSVTS
jgi:HSP20 family molecular chaperone IbpA